MTASAPPSQSAREDRESASPRIEPLDEMKRRSSRAKLVEQSHSGTLQHHNLAHRATTPPRPQSSALHQYIPSVPPSDAQAAVGPTPCAITRGLPTLLGARVPRPVRHAATTGIPPGRLPTRTVVAMEAQESGTRDQAAAALEALVASRSIVVPAPEATSLRPCRCMARPASRSHGRSSTSAAAGRYGGTASCRGREAVSGKISAEP